MLYQRARSGPTTGSKLDSTPKPMFVKIEAHATSNESAAHPHTHVLLRGDKRNKTAKTRVGTRPALEDFAVTRGAVNDPVPPSQNRAQWPSRPCPERNHVSLSKNTCTFSCWSSVNTEIVRVIAQVRVIATLCERKHGAKALNSVFAQGSWLLHTAR